MNKPKSTRVTKQLLKYVIVGIASNTAGYLVYLLITYLGVAPKIAMSALYVAGAAVGFFGNSRLTFSYQGAILGSGVRYLMAHSVGYLMNFTFLVICVDIFGYQHQLIQAIAVFLVATFLFLAFKFFVFRTTKARPIS